MNLFQPSLTFNDRRDVVPLGISTGEYECLVESDEVLLDAVDELGSFSEALKKLLSPKGSLEGETLLESELFGHEKGAFTGAVERKVGKLELAEGGTVFLDEIGEVPPGLQAKLLRALETREIEPIGGRRPVRVDIRLIAATNRDLEQAMRDGGFRDDLYYRLNVLSLELPPLRLRRADIPLLARHFVDRLGRRLNRRLTGLSPEARKALMAYDWPGNVRELANAAERAVVLGQDDLVRPEDLPKSVLESHTAEGETYHEVLNATKRRLILDAVRATGGHYTRAAERLGLHPNYLHRLVRNLGLKAKLKAATDTP